MCGYIGSFFVVPCLGKLEGSGLFKYRFACFPTVKEIKGVFGILMDVMNRSHAKILAQYYLQLIQFSFILRIEIICILINQYALIRQSQ